MQHDGYFETLVTAAYPKRKITFRNLGWSGDTVWGDSRAVFGTRADGFKRLVADVKLCRPTVMIVGYGENEAYAGEAGLGEFRAGLNTLLDALEATGARLVLLGPRPHENLGPPLPDPANYNADLRKYTQVIQEAAGERGHAFADLTGKIEKRFNRSLSAGEARPWTHNGLHLTSVGRLAAAVVMADALGVPPSDWSVTLDAATGAYDAVGTTLTSLVLGVEVDSHKVTFDAISHVAALPAVRLGSGLNTVNLGSWGTLRVRSLSAGNYELRADGVKLADASADRLAGGIMLNLNHPRGDRLRHIVQEKNELFFHRYRPQNETYLFLFRKHEQGNNAVEIPQFDPLIAEKEAEIAKLKQPVQQKFEIVRVP